MAADVNFAVGNGRDGEFDGGVGLIAPAGSLAAIVKFGADVGSGKGVEDGGSAAATAIGLEGPEDGSGGAVGGDAGGGAAIAIADRRLAGRSGVQQTAGEGKGFDWAAAAMVINLVIEIGRRTPGASDGVGEFLDDLVNTGVELAEVVAVHEINLTFLSAAHEEMGMGGAAHRIRQDHGATGGEVSVPAVKVGVVEGCEIIGELEAVGGGELDDTFAEAPVVGISVGAIVGAVAGFEVHIARRVDRGRLAA